MIEKGVLTLSRLEIQSFYNDLRKVVETVLCSPSVDNSSTIFLKHQEWCNLIVSALEAIKDSNIETTEDDTVEEDRIRSDGTRSHVTGDEAMDNATVTVDEVLDKLLDNATGAYGFSAQDVYGAISLPGLTQECIDEALRGLTYRSLREAVTKAGAAEPKDTVLHTIFAMDPTESIRNVHNPNPGVGFAVKFKSLRIRTMVLEKLYLPQHLKTTLLSGRWQM